MSLINYTEVVEFKFSEYIFISCILWLNEQTRIENFNI